MVCQPNAIAPLVWASPDEVFDEPANLFVAEFIGAPKMNTFKTQLVKENGKYYVTPFGAKIEVDGKKGERLKAAGIDSREVILGVSSWHRYSNHE